MLHFMLHNRLCIQPKTQYFISTSKRRTQPKYGQRKSIYHILSIKAIDCSLLLFVETTGYPDFKMGSTTALVQTVEFFMATMCAKWPKIDRNVLICIGNVGFQKFHSSYFLLDFFANGHEPSS